MAAMRSITEMEQNIRTYDMGVDEMLSQAKTLSDEIRDVAHMQGERHLS